ncbi:MAG TPA: cytochrome c3 family protein [Smithellaceae bacterium]|nr:cytochrome c3 family protein [Smithellaceae bacterium]
MKVFYSIIIFLAALGIADAGTAAPAAFSDGGGIIYTEPLPTVIFRHQHHVDIKKIGCDKCHSGLFEMEALQAQTKKDFVMEYFYQGKYCGSCHNGKDAFASETQCARCHIRPTGSESGHMKGKPAPYQKPVYNTSVLIGNSARQARFEHGKHAPAALCRDCHPRPFQVKKGANSITLGNHSQPQYCFRCHDGKKSFSYLSCRSCHQQWTDIARAGELKPGAGRDSSCYQCHTSDAKMKTLVKAPAIGGEGEG